MIFRSLCLFIMNPGRCDNCLCNFTQTLLPREVAVYETPQQVRELVRSCLKDSEGRARLARAGHERVLAQHTYRHRMMRVLDSL